MGFSYILNYENGEQMYIIIEKQIDTLVITNEKQFKLIVHSFTQKEKNYVFKVN